MNLSSSPLSLVASHLIAAHHLLVSRGTVGLVDLASDRLLALPHHQEILLSLLLLVGQPACVSLVLELLVVTPRQNGLDPLYLALFANLSLRPQILGVHCVTRTCLRNVRLDLVVIVIALFALALLVITATLQSGTILGNPLRQTSLGCLLRAVPISVDLLIYEG